MAQQCCVGGDWGIGTSIKTSRECGLGSRRPIRRSFTRAGGRVGKEPDPRGRDGPLPGVYAPW
eukprot:gene43681-51423_t